MNHLLGSQKNHTSYLNVKGLIVSARKRLLWIHWTLKLYHQCFGNIDVRWPSVVQNSLPPVLPALSHMDPVHTLIPNLFKVHFSVISPSVKQPLSSGISGQCPVCISQRIHAWYIAHSSHPLRVDHSNSIWRKVWIWVFILFWIKRCFVI
jgi:hypothetical protein